MPISDDDLNYLRNINTRPGPNAGKSIDPTKPGPSDKTDEWDREHAKSRVIVQAEKGRFEAIDKAALAQSDARSETRKRFDAFAAALDPPALAQSDAGPQDVRVDANVETVADVRRAIKEAWLVDGEKTDFDADRLALAAIKALAQSDAKSAADAGLIEAAEWFSTAASRFEEAADALRSEYKTYARQMDRWAGDTRERARLFRILSRAADRSVHGEPIPDCPTDGVAARQGNGG